MVGASTHWKRPSSYAMKYLSKKGYRVIPINPSRAGKEILGEQVYGSIADYPGHLDMVDIFRTSEEAYDITKDVIANIADKGIKVLWMQLTVRNDKAAELAEEAGLTVIMNRCPKIEYARLSGELSWSGINSKIVSAKSLRPPRA
ncbi:MAG: CoA-binding protein [Rhodospirillaceae bacterium]|nr:CoA-binding protein [Rhodospirillaceae bacterium]MBT3927606.1 CoA-binding protein [Rhodospirillaceae bacterium]MBT5037576.1 CoA-binding protein [Rhodospirillaceae bacterium]MBT5677183.1 CoA-binding protein [Rhodospirillaceae bacterium]MBT5780070.1 CoA-binding protein [Rhodospirillaceae bacterium]